MIGPLAPGRVVERYRVEEFLGEGGTAVVYRVRHVHLGTDHALKVMTLGGAHAGPRLLLEGRVQAALRHPNVVAVTDVLELDGGYGLLMEYVPPPSLALWLQRNGRARPEVAEALFRGIVEGVRHAHAHGLVHRDLKPANVLLARGESGLVPKVSDFGLARLLDEEGGHRHTRSGLAMGTPQYMAPEQFRDAKTVDRRADLFSLGCLLHELLSGEPAFAWTDMIGVYEAMAAGRYAPLPADVPARLAAAVAGCLAADRDARIPDCGTLLAVLDGASRGPTLVPGAADRAHLLETTAALDVRSAPTLAASPTLAAPTLADLLQADTATLLPGPLPEIPGIEGEKVLGRGDPPPATPPALTARGAPTAGAGPAPGGTPEDRDGSEAASPEAGNAPRIGTIPAAPQGNLASEERAGIGPPGALPRDGARDGRHAPVTPSGALAPSGGEGGRPSRGAGPAPGEGSAGSRTRPDEVRDGRRAAAPRWALALGGLVVAGLVAAVAWPPSDVTPAPANLAATPGTTTPGAAAPGTATPGAAAPDAAGTGLAAGAPDDVGVPGPPPAEATSARPRPEALSQHDATTPRDAVAPTAGGSSGATAAPGTRPPTPVTAQNTAANTASMQGASASGSSGASATDASPWLADRPPATGRGNPESPAATPSAAPTTSAAPTASAAPTTAAVRGSGAQSVWLIGPDGRQVLPAKVRPGRYEVWADFGAGPVEAGEATLAAGDDAAISCNASFGSCQVRR